MTLLDARPLPRPRDVSGEFGIYVHVPFCSHRCWYCDFNAYADLDHLQEVYMRALAQAARADSMADKPPVTSVFIGGGTPSRVPAASIAAVLDAVRSSWDVAAGAEVTIECNPESTDPDKLRAYRDAGITRISFGVQSLHEPSLQQLGRAHDAATALRAIDQALAIFDDVSADLIFGIPGEDDATWRASLDGVLAAGVTHVSAYALIYEEGTPLESWRKLGKVIPVDDDAVAARWDIANDVLGSRGFERYEISNWSMPGRASRHNSLYWACGEYLGIGAGAHAHVDGSRSWTLRSPERWAGDVLAGGTGSAGSEVIDRSMRATEVMLLGLRRTDGVAEADFAALVGAGIDEVFAGALAEGTARGLLDRSGGRVRLTRPFLANAATVLFA